MEDAATGAFSVFFTQSPPFPAFQKTTEIVFMPEKIFFSRIRFHRWCSWWKNRSKKEQDSE